MSSSVGPSFVQTALELEPAPIIVPTAPLVCPECKRPFPVPDNVGRQHRDARETERAAALRQAPRIGTGRQRVLHEFQIAGAAGRTDEELSVALEMRLYTAAPRRNELLTGGWIVDSGETRPTSTGSPATVWRLSDWGAQRLGMETP